MIEKQFFGSLSDLSLGILALAARNDRLPLKSGCAAVKDEDRLSPEVDKFCKFDGIIPICGNWTLQQLTKRYYRALIGCVNFETGNFTGRIQIPLQKTTDIFPYFARASALGYRKVYFLSPLTTLGWTWKLKYSGYKKIYHLSPLTILVGHEKISIQTPLSKIPIGNISMIGSIGNISIDWFKSKGRFYLEDISLE